MASEIVHIFGVLGSRAVIQLGSCGGLCDSMEAGDLVIATEAYCGEGAAQYYCPRVCYVSCSREILSTGPIEALHQRRVHQGPIFTTSALLAEGREELDDWHRRGFVAVDMETATSFAVASYFGMARASILYVFDTPRHEDHLLVTDEAKNALRAHGYAAATDAALALALELSAS